MEKLLVTTMQNPTAENKKRLIAYDRKHPFAAIFLSAVQATILEQYKKEA